MRCNSGRSNTAAIHLQRGVPVSRSPRRQEQQAFARAPIAAAIAALGLSGAFAVHAADAPAAAAPAASAASAADAANEAPALDAVTVHSRNRIERLQDVPLSVSVTTGAELARLNAYGVEAIAKRAANISWNQGNQRTSSIAIRGIGKIGQTEAQDPSVGVIVDGVPYAYNALTSPPSPSPHSAPGAAPRPPACSTSTSGCAPSTSAASRCNATSTPARSTPPSPTRRSSRACTA